MEQEIDLKSMSLDNLENLLKIDLSKISIEDLKQLYKDLDISYFYTNLESDCGECWRYLDTCHNLMIKVKKTHGVKIIDCLH